jgi:hypothetical protein
VKVWIKPAEGLKIRMPPRRKFLPAEGAWFEKDDFVRRLIADKDVVEGKPPEAAAAPPAEAAPAPEDAPEPEHSQENAS